MALLRRLFEAAVAAVSADRIVPPALPDPPRGRTVVVGAGKAAAAMAAAVESRWPAPLSGLVVTRYGHGLPTRHIEVVEAGHPMPDAAGTEAAARMLALVRGLGPDDLVLALISGGASALLSLPIEGVGAEDKRAVTRALLRSGAPIDAMNTVRRHLSAIKGGRLAAASAPARVVGLLLSDVPGDDPAVIGSGPTVPDPTTRADALDVLARYGIEVPDSVRRVLAEDRSETPKPGDPAFRHVDNRIVGRPRDGLRAAADAARGAGLSVLTLGDRIEGEAREVGRALAGIAHALADGTLDVSPPAVILSGGETTVTVRGDGRGGRNLECLAGLALGLGGRPGVWSLACDTDGIDGTEDNAGAVAGPDTIARLAGLGIDLGDCLARNDAHRAFSGLGDLLVTGPTRTNINDFRAILVLPDAGAATCPPVS